MPAQGNKRLIGVVDDLLFVVKIKDAAIRSGLQPKFVKGEEEALAAVADPPLLVIVDLNAHSVDPIELIRKIKSDGRQKVPVLAFVSHVQGELKQQAHDAGADMVMARSAFSTNLPQILKRHAGTY